MSYISWFRSHTKKHQAIMQKLSNLSDDEVIEYFCWENMIINEPDFCPLYKENKKCHDMRGLNCYLCACPNFRFDDEALKTKSWCDIRSKDGAQVEFGGVIHQDCSNCTVPHHKHFIKDNFSRSWNTVMNKVYTV